MLIHLKGCAACCYLWGSYLASEEPRIGPSILRGSSEMLGAFTLPILQVTPELQCGLSRDPGQPELGGLSPLFLPRRNQENPPATTAGDSRGPGSFLSPPRLHREEEHREAQQTPDRRQRTAGIHRWKET
ncbi:hypothetical protein H1C71_021137 [Ictidomys tridecemlineatus]|nr:hypothetical protein H1C71_021137 [Ictidomys tridecemlineatus]KAG3275668.1 hypothetical protein H1C71_021137 [Ictidomys tridecemlineatus]